MKRGILVLVVWIFISIPVMAQNLEEYDFDIIEEELEELGKGEHYYEEILRFDGFGDLVRKIISGEVRLGLGEIFTHLINLVLGELREQWRLIVELAVLLIFSGMLKALDLSLGNAQVEQIAFYVLFGTAVTILFQSFYNAYLLAVETGENMQGVLMSLIPVLAAIKAGTGESLGAAMQTGFLLSAVNFVYWLVQNVFYTGIMLFMVLACFNQLTGQNLMKRITGLAKTLVQKGIKGVSAIFLFLISWQGMNAGAVDGWMKKGLVTAAGAVPVVGDVLSGAVDTILAGAGAVSQCVGSAGMIILLCICMVPMAKLLAMWLLYKVTGAVLSPIADAKLSELLDSAGESVGMLMGILMVLIGMFVCGIGIFLKAR